MSKIALFGGTFNPVHNAHIHFCEECDKQMNFDKIMLIPTKKPVHKSSEDLVSDVDRINMLNLSIKNKDKFIISDIEIKSEKRNYTIYTINELKKIYPEGMYDMYFLMGSDMFLMFDKWKNFNDILEKVTIVTGARSQDDYKKLLSHKAKFIQNKDKIIILDIDIIELSSTQVRDNMCRGIVQTMVCKEVYDYIVDKNLYR